MSYLARYCNAVETDPADPIDVRCRLIFRELERACRETGARILCIEVQDMAQVAQREEGRSSAHSMQHVQKTVGVALGVAYAYGFDVAWCYPQQAKIAMLGSGGGKATKAEIKKACQRLVQFDRGCRLVGHSADAVAIAVRGHHQLGGQASLVCGFDPGLHCGIAVVERA